MSATRLPERDGEVGGEQSLAFTVDTPVTLDVLDAQITREMGWRKAAGLLAEGDTSTASKEAPVVIWIMRDDVDTRTVRSVVAAHQGVDGTTPDADALAVLQAKVAAGEELTAEEMQTVLRLLLTRG